MKKLFLILISLSVSNMFAQDIIVKKDGTTILSKVTEVSSSEVKYKKHSNLNGPTYTLATSEILSVNYENGEKENFGEAQVQTKQTQSTGSRILKAGTEIPIQIVSPVKAADVEVGQTVNFKVSRDISVDGTTVIPYGTPVKGTVYKADRSSWFGTKGKLGIRLDNIQLPSGERIPLSNGDVYVTGTNRTPLAVLLFLLVTIPAAFICGSKAQIPVGYEVLANVADNVYFDSAGKVKTEVVYTPTNSTTTASTYVMQGFPWEGTIYRKSWGQIDGIILSIENGDIQYTTKGNNQTPSVIKAKEVGKIVLNSDYIPTLPCNAILNIKGKETPAIIKDMKEKSITYELKSGDVIQTLLEKIKEIFFEVPNSSEKYGFPVYYYRKI